jgi:hypothetical protein
MKEKQDTSSNNTGPGLPGAGFGVRSPKVKGTAVPASMGDRTSGQPNPTGPRGKQG